MGWPLVIGCALVCVSLGLSVWAKTRYMRAETIAVQRKSRMLSVVERNLFDCLIQALSEQYFIFAKVALKDVIEVAPGAKKFNLQRVRKELDDYTFDFILCNRVDMSIFAVVELEHIGRAVKGKNSVKPNRRDKVISRACKSASLKVFYFDLRQDYRNMDISRLITGKSRVMGHHQGSSSATHKSQLSIDNVSFSVAGHVRNCPKCRSEVVTKVSVKGGDIGEKFLMCRKYPYCDYRVAIKDIDSIKKLEQEESLKSKAQGFKDWSAG
jgi:hypothetical protein